MPRDMQPRGRELHLCRGLVPHFPRAIAAGTTKTDVLIPYATKLSSAGDVRKVAVAMHKGAFDGMGHVYKLRKGYYQGAVKQGE